MLALSKGHLCQLRGRSHSSNPGIGRLFSGIQAGQRCTLLLLLAQGVAQEPYLHWCHLLTAPGHIASVNSLFPHLYNGNNHINSQGDVRIKWEIQYKMQTLTKWKLSFCVLGLILGGDTMNEGHLSSNASMLTSMTSPVVCCGLIGYWI